jgi:hypothetical protein
LPLPAILCPLSDRYIIPDGARRNEESQTKHGKMPFDCPADTTYNPYDASFIRNRRPQEDCPSGDTGQTYKDWYGFAGLKAEFGMLSRFSIPVET